MPGPLLHVGAVVLCMHGGQAIPVTPNPRVLVNGQPTVTMASQYAIVGCTLLPSPCVTARWVTAAMRVSSNGVPLLLFDSQATCVPNATPLIVTFVQPRVTGM
jgi:hypothetical protein